MLHDYVPRGVRRWGGGKGAGGEWVCVGCCVRTRVPWGWHAGVRLRPLSCFLAAADTLARHPISILAVRNNLEILMRMDYDAFHEKCAYAIQAVNLAIEQIGIHWVKLAHLSGTFVFRMSEEDAWCKYILIKACLFRHQVYVQPLSTGINSFSFAFKQEHFNLFVEKFIAAFQDLAALYRFKKDG